jgi:hypothetical protein
LTAASSARAAGAATSTDVAATTAMDIRLSIENLPFRRAMDHPSLSIPWRRQTPPRSEKMRTILDQEADDAAAPDVTAPGDGDLKRP